MPTLTAPTPDTTPRRPRSALRVLASLGVLVTLAAVGVAGTYSALNDVSSNPGNSFSAGSVSVTDNDAGASLLTLTNAKPGDIASGCIVVTYGGSLPANVRLYGATTGTGLDQYLTLKVTRGTISAPTAGSCTGFTADSTNYITQGAGVVYNGNLSAWPSTSATALDDPTTAAKEIWNQNEKHAYRLDVTVQNDPLGQGKTATESFTWEAQNT
jgi:predicted ribosomally synthesized peptide with SipW-like signal peptide